ncbi:MAG: DUF1178 family protein [Sphingomonadaceae bacterium]|nr:DUF1178 family protein [Sphingomonadaceae bacterium]
MISFDLRCALDHVFEGWFRSSEDFAAQQAGGLIACPICGNDAVRKAVMAPQVAAKGNAVRSVKAPTLPPEAMALIGKIAAMQAEALPHSRWVGGDFATEARALHAAGDDTASPSASVIHGQASADDVAALHADGINVMPLLVPFVPPDAQN